MLETILAISGKPGLYKLVSRGNNNLIVETIDAQKKRFPAFAADKVISLADIAMYTDEKEVPLREVLNSIKTKEGGKVASIDYRKASKEELFAYLGEVLPNFDRDRVYPADAKKLVQWYNLLVENGLDNFDETLQETEGDNIDDIKAKTEALTEKFHTISAKMYQQAQQAQEHVISDSLGQRVDNRVRYSDHYPVFARILYNGKTN